MLCTFKKLIYPKVLPPEDSGYRIVLYQPCEKLRDAAGRPVTEVKAVGFFLPTGENLSYELKGRWARDSKYGVQFQVEDYQEVIAPTKEGIIAYLSSGKIKGIGPKMAEKIYAAFGPESLEIFEHHPERLLDIPGITSGKLEGILRTYLATRSTGEVIAFLAPFGVSPSRAARIAAKLGQEALGILKEHPYRLCGLENVDFYLADKIAQNQSLDPCAAERVDACLLQVLLTAEQQGHLCLDKRDFIQKALQLLQTEGITVDLAANCAARLVENRRLLTYRKWVYRWEAGCAERNLARRIAAMLPQPAVGNAGELSQQLLDVERELGITLNDQQRKAVLTAVASPLSIITGGPGTGKTTTQRALLALYRRRKPSGRVVCCAPTGRAARRMEESTGETAQTLHKAMQLSHLEDGTYCAPKMLEADLVLVDEVSMMDAFLAECLLEALPEGCQLVLIGDADQLPSVGPGVVLRELIASGQVPVVRLTKIYRQHAGSRIAINAALIRTGNLHLEYGSDFVFVESANLGASAGLIEELYLREVGRFGVDNVALLSPFRKRTETGVDALNLRLQEKVNPPDPAKSELTLGKRTFRLGDKVMQVKNFEDVSNGDIGKVTEVDTAREEPFLTVDFGDGRVKEYARPDLDRLDLAYAATIHKSQGSEYHTVIVNLQCAHAVMLTRPLLYTAITRAKKRVILVGERKALCMAIRRMDTDQRNTQLAAQILDQIHIQREEKEHGKLS